MERKIILSDALKLALLVLLGIFAYQNINLVLAKLRFVEIADDLNASFLEMRLSEKNYFLYKDESALFIVFIRFHHKIPRISQAGGDAEILRHTAD